MESNILSNLKELSTELAAQPDTWKQMTILEAVTTIEALRQENEQLQTQVAQYRETLEQARAAIKHLSLCDCNYNCEDCPIDNKLCSIYADGTIIDDVLAAIDKIGGREDG